MPDLIRLGRKVVQQLVLPGRRRQGNLLSSLFLLFTGLAEQAIALRRALLRIPWALNTKSCSRLGTAWSYSKKYLRQGIIAATWLLFILSSFEWSGPGQSPCTDATATAQATAIATAPAMAKPVAFCAANHQQPGLLSINTGTTTLPAIPRQSAPIRRWLRLCSLRI